MKFYFLLQERMIRRQLNGLGLNPILTYIVSAIAFILLSIYLFHKTKYGVYLYVMIPVSMAANLGNGERNYFVRSVYSRRKFFVIRALENVLIAFPFFTFLIFQKQWFVAVSLMMVNIIQSFFKIRNSSAMVIPTPFFKYPYEFTTGFRKSFLLILICYGLAVIAVIVNNFNLGLFSIVLIAVSCTFFYATPEPLFYVWIFSSDSAGFLLQKAKTGILYGMLLMLPVSILMEAFFISHFYIIAGVYISGVILVLITIFAKYSSYPAEISISKVIITVLSAVLSVFFPPLLLLLVPMFYIQSKKQLKPILG